MGRRWQGGPKATARRSKYGIEQEEYEGLLEAQGYVCAICGGTDEGKDLAVDHDHETGKIRGLLCTACNCGLSMFKDSQPRLAEAISYLRERA